MHAAPFAMSVRLQRLLLEIAIAVIANGQREVRLPPWFSCQRVRSQSPTPVNWKNGEDVIIAGSVSDDDAKKQYPQGWMAPKAYLRIVPQPK